MIKAIKVYMDLLWVPLPSFTDSVAYGEISLFLYITNFTVLWILKGEAGTNGPPGPNGAVGLLVS